MESSCRLCLQESLELSNVFEIRDNSEISEIINIICLIEIDRTDAYSKEVCRTCLETVLAAHELRILSGKNDRYLKEQHQEGKLLVKIEDENIDDLIKYEASPSPVVESDIESDDEVRDYSVKSYEVIEVEMNPVIFTEELASSYKCDLCLHIAADKLGMEIHIKNEHLAMNVCSLCLKQFSSSGALKKHMRVQHLTEESLSCDQCNMFFKTYKKFEKHQEIHSFFASENGSKSYRCRHCSKFYQNYSEKMYDHIYYHKKPKMKAEKTTNPKTKKTPEEYEPLICPHCGCTYRTKQILQQHIKRHFDTGAYACQKCPQKFKSWGELYYHNAVHMTERNFICEICSKAFKAKRDLRNHRIRHETKDVKTFQCTYCNLMLKSKYTLNRHILIHTGEKKHTCTYCSKAFTQKNELNKHLRIHIGEKTYKCEEIGCSEAFRLLSELRLHQQEHYLKPS